MIKQQLHTSGMSHSTRNELLLFSGLPASGKTTEALKWVAEDPDARLRVNYDDMRLAWFGPSWKFNRGDEDKIQKAARSTVQTALTKGLSVVIDNTNLSSRVRDKWVNLGKSLGAEVVEQEFDTPIAECKLRDQKREGTSRVGWAVIDWMALNHGFINWDDRSIYNREKFIVVDMDGTLSDCEWRRHFVRGETIHYDFCPTLTSSEPVHFVGGHCVSCHTPKFKKDWKSFFEGVEKDPPNLPVLNLVKHLCYFGYDLLIVSGRPMDQCGKGTEAWLRKYLLEAGILPRHLFMRRGNDSRSDVEVKQEICDLLPKDRIAYVLDDRSSVVEMWRKNGLTCLQVADGNF